MHELLFQDVCFHISWWLISSIKKGSYQAKVNSSISPSGKRCESSGASPCIHWYIHPSATFFLIIHIQFITISPRFYQSRTYIMGESLTRTYVYIYIYIYTYIYIYSLMSKQATASASSHRGFVFQGYLQLSLEAGGGYVRGAEQKDMELILWFGR